MIQAKKLGHIVLRVSDVRASRDFYRRVLGLEVASEDLERGMCFLSAGDDHHDIGLFQHATGPRPGPEQPGLVHIAWNVGAFEDVQAAYRELTEAGYAVEAMQHNVTNSIYVDDPDGHTVELYCDRWEDGFEAMRTKGPLTVPLDIETGEAIPQ